MPQTRGREGRKGGLCDRAHLHLRLDVVVIVFTFDGRHRGWGRVHATHRRPRRDLCGSGVDLCSDAGEETKMMFEQACLGHFHSPSVV